MSPQEPQRIFSNLDLSRLIIPLIIEQFLSCMVGMIDTMMISSLGEAAVSGVSLVDLFNILIINIFSALSTGGAVVASQFLGAKRVRDAQGSTKQLLLVTLATSLLLLLLAQVFNRQLIRLFFGSIDAEVMSASQTYFRITSLAFPAIALFNACAAIFRAMGNSKVSMFGSLLCNVVNVCGNALLIYVFQMGVAGAAWAMVLAQGAAFVYSLVFLARRPAEYPFRLRLPGLAEFRTILELGVPSGVQMVVIYAGTAVILSLVNSFGGQVVAGFGAAQRLDSIVLLPAVALGMAVNAMAAQNIGAGQWGRVAEVTRAGVICNVAIMAAISGVLLVWAGPLVELFVRDRESVAFGASYLRTIALFYPFIGLNFIFNGVVRSSGAMLQVLVLNIISLWVLRVPLAHWLADMHGEPGIALGIGISFLLSSLFSLAYYRWGGWRRKQLFREAEAAAGG